jgi:hypothetical protein
LQLSRLAALSEEMAAAEFEELVLQQFLLQLSTVAALPEEIAVGGM